MGKSLSQDNSASKGPSEMRTEVWLASLGPGSSHRDVQRGTRPLGFAGRARCIAGEFGTGHGRRGVKESGECVSR